MTDEFDPSVRDEAAAGAAASVPPPLPTDAVAAGRRSPLMIDAAARQAGCTPAYLSECIACGQLAGSGAGTVDVDALTAWIERSLRPQQRALRAVVDAIDTMELRSLKPAVGGPATGEPSADTQAGVSADVGADAQTDHAQPLASTFR